MVLGSPMDLTLPLLDPAPLQSLYTLPGGKEAVVELIGIVEEDVPMRLNLIREFLAEGRFKDAGIEAHSLKGGAGNMGLRRFAEVIKFFGIKRDGSVRQHRHAANTPGALFRYSLRASYNACPSFIHGGHSLPASSGLAAIGRGCWRP